MREIKQKVLNHKAFIFGSIYGVLLLSIFYHLYFAKKIIPGVRVGNVAVGGLTYDAAYAKLIEQQLAVGPTLTLKYGTFTYDIQVAEIGLDYNAEAAVVRAFEVGRTGNIYVDTKDKLAGLFKPLVLRAYYTVDNAALSAVFSSLKGELNKIPQNAYFEFVANELQVFEDAPGQKLDGQELYETVIDSLDFYDFSPKQLRVDQVQPKISKRDLESFYQQAKELTAQTVELTYNQKKFVVDKKTLASFLQVKADAGTFVLGINNPIFEGWVTSFAKQFDTPPRAKIKQLSGNDVLALELVESGIKLDTDKFKAQFRDALFANKKTLALPVNKVEGVLSPQAWGIKTLLGEGNSKYIGSGAGRIHNLALAAERTNGVLVPPDSVYSFNNAIGQVTAATGYQTAYIISNGRTVLGDGGGVCQTSTTLFRAVLASGLPVVVRHPHAYRVHYYELESPLGMDASVYQPALDFQFKNDTKAYILITSEADLKELSLKFKIWGTYDGRTVKISEPVVTKEVGAPATLYQNDPTLAKGVVKQVDFSSPGATVYFERVVERNGKELFKEKYTSVYQPWRAIFLVGTKK